VAGVVALLGRTSERDETAQGARELGELLGARLVGEVEPPRLGHWDEDLRAAAPVLRAARDAVLDGTRTFVAGHCNLAIATLPALAAAHPGLRVAWFDAHADFNTPETSPSGFLGGMPLAAACGVWDAGLQDPPLDPGRVHLVGVRDLDEDEREVVARAGVRVGVPHHGPVYVHLDCDVLDPSVMRTQFPVPGGMNLEGLRALLAGLDGRIVGMEVTALEDPAMAGAIAELLP
jgi:arginase family enzyme